MRQYDWDNLRVFLAASRAPSALDASHGLMMSQSTISRRIQRLEKDMSVKLFERSPQGWRLTTVGHRLIEHVERLESTLAAAESNVLDQSALSGEIRLGCTEAFGSFFLAPHVARFCRQHPAITVDLLPMPRTLNLSKREADASIAIDRPSAKSFITCRLARYRLLPFASKEYLENHARIASVEDLKEHSWIDYVDDLIFSPQQFSLHKWLPSVRARLRSTSVIAQSQAVRAGLGIAVLPYFLGSAIEGLVPVLPNKIEITRTFWLIAPPERREIARVKALWAYLRSVADANRQFLMGRAKEIAWLEGLNPVLASH